MPIKNRIAGMQDDITAWRRNLHAHPEILYETHRTSAFVAEMLRDFGCDEVVTGIGRTGVVGVIRGTRDSAGKVVGLRADMDALPIHEVTGLDYASEIPGAMHACGHDGHTAMLLGAAKYLAETRNFDGTVVVIFQPAEEGGAGGRAMCEDGMMDRWNIQEVYGLHNMPGIPVGQFAIRPGGLLASGDIFHIKVTGKGGHAAMPHLSLDTTLVAAQIVVSLQSIVARNVDPLESMVVTVGMFNTDSNAPNVIAHEVRMSGTVRALSPAMRQLSHERVREIAVHTAAAYGAQAEVTFDPGYPATVNHPDQTEYAALAAEAVAGHVDRNVAPLMAAEDFAFMLEERPGAYIFLGNGDSAACHHPAYDFNDAAIPAGSSFFATLAEQRMPLD
ncbi:M20 aminoacylase family protein [Seohaeicola saemankumensis]|uniref:M20 aminoacylase family protein n=1 Tax=Seohaeicola TaxID=481178 RepID=UPI0035D01B84